MLRKLAAGAGLGGGAAEALGGAGAARTARAGGGLGGAGLGVAVTAGPAGLSTGAGYLAARWERDRAPERTVLFIAADTGHRYVDSVFARYREAPRVEDLVPRAVTTVDELALPWSRMDWNRAPAPATAAV